MKPEHAALTSKQAAVAGIGRSGVIVATIKRSMSEALTPASSRARCPARTPRSDVACSSEAILRSRIPLRARIHSSEVSTIRARSSLVKMRSGAYEPVPSMTVERLGMPEVLADGHAEELVRACDVSLHPLVHVRLDDLAGRADRALDGVAVRGAVRLEDVAAKPEK